MGGPTAQRGLGPSLTLLHRNPRQIYPDLRGVTHTLGMAV